MIIWLVTKNDWLTDNDYLKVDRMIDWSIGWLVDWLIDQLTNKLINH